MDNDIINSFSGDISNIKQLSGGQNTSILSGNVVIKPIDEPEKYCWLAEELNHVRSAKIFIANPILNNDKNYLYKGYGATKYIKCHYHPNKLRQKMKAAEEFHRIVKGIKKPERFDTWVSPWSEATKIAWQENELPKTNDEIVDSILKNIVNEYRAILLEKQFIHSDLAGNILFQYFRPVIIDISPEFRPIEYAHTLLITDSIAWHGASIKSLKLLKYEESLKRQLILRAVMFRLCVPLCFNKENIKGFIREYEDFKSILIEIGVRDLTTAST